jgi:hypothetical protein
MINWRGAKIMRKFTLLYFIILISCYNNKVIDEVSGKNTNSEETSDLLGKKVNNNEIDLIEDDINIFEKSIYKFDSINILEEENSNSDDYIPNDNEVITLKPLDDGRYMFSFNYHISSMGKIIILPDNPEISFYEDVAEMGFGSMGWEFYYDKENDILIMHFYYSETDISNIEDFENISEEEYNNLPRRYLSCNMIFKK